MRSAAIDDEPDLAYEVPIAIRKQSELDPIEAWLKLNIRRQWRMEFDGVAGEADHAGQQRLRVVFAFADQEDAGRFQRDRAATHLVPGNRTEERRSRWLSEARALTSRPTMRPRSADRDDSQSFVRHAGELVRARIRSWRARCS